MVASKNFYYTNMMMRMMMMTNANTTIRTEEDAVYNVITSVAGWGIGKSILGNRWLLIGLHGLLLMLASTPL